MLQEIVVLLVFAAALTYLGYRGWKGLQRPAAGGCAKGCGCEAASGKNPVSDKAHS